MSASIPLLRDRVRALPWRPGRTDAIIAGVALVVVVLLVRVDDTTVRSQEGLGTVPFGLPLKWISQDQTLDPPGFPFTTGFMAPQEYVTTLHWGWLLVDVAIVWVVLSLLWRAGRAWWVRRPVSR